jgi:hypothetical protein
MRGGLSGENVEGLIYTYIRYILSRVSPNLGYLNA